MNTDNSEQMTKTEKNIRNVKKKIENSAEKID